MNAGEVMSAGEAADLRTRLSSVESDAMEALKRMAVHEQQCASRYQHILFLLGVSVLLSLPAALPHIATLIGLLK